MADGHRDAWHTFEIHVIARVTRTAPANFFPVPRGRHMISETGPPTEQE